MANLIMYLHIKLTFERLDFHLDIFIFINRTDEEVAAKTATGKQMRDLSNQLQEITEDLDVEKESRHKAEKQKRDLSEVRILCVVFRPSLRDPLAEYLNRLFEIV